jgi:hypothetical protein
MKTPGLIFKLTAMMILSFTCSTTFGQQQISNGGFEAWEEIRSGVEEPVSWNSIKNTDGSKVNKSLAPTVWEKSLTAHSGKSSVRLTNKSVIGIVANGMLTNCAIHGEKDKTKSYVYTDASNPGFNAPFVSRPDSVTGWYMYTPSEKDSAMVVLLLHDGKVTLPDKGTKSSWVGGVKLMLGATPPNTWTRFSIPIQYFKKSGPKYMILVLSSGNRMKAVEGSVAYFDDLKLVYNK